MSTTRPTTEEASTGLRGTYHDVLRDPRGSVICDRGWTHNTIVVDCRRLLAGFMAGPAFSLGIQGLSVGQGSASWDASSPPVPVATQAALVDPNPFLVPRTSLQIDFLNGSVISAAPTNRLQVVATLGPNVPTWPDANHVSGNLREFGLVGRLNGANVLINCVTHPVIVKDPTSTLTRTIVLVF